jgi:hypothetical protein
MAAITEQIQGLVELRGLRNEAEKTGFPAATYLRANPVRSAPGAASTARMNPAASIIGKISPA